MECSCIHHQGFPGHWTELFSPFLSFQNLCPIELCDGYQKTQLFNKHLDSASDSTNWHCFKGGSSDDWLKLFKDNPSIRSCDIISEHLSMHWKSNTLLTGRIIQSLCAILAQFGFTLGSENCSNYCMMGIYNVNYSPWGVEVNPLANFPLCHLNYKERNWQHLAFLTQFFQILRIILRKQQ